MPIESYEKVGYVGDGSFGRVKKVRRTRDSKILACKHIDFKGTKTSKAVAERECEILKQLKHPNIVRQYEEEWCPHKVKIYMEYCEGGSLQDLIKEREKEKTLLSEKYVSIIAYQLALALLYCHTGRRIDGDGNPSSHRKDWKTILHRDIKPANVFMMNRSETALDSIKLGDFGLGYVLRNDDHPGSYVGTGQFLAPEISRQSDDPIRWTTGCDIFSFGCTLYTLCTLRPPFANHLEAKHESYSQIPNIYTRHLRNLIASCLSFSPDARPRNVFHLVQQCQHQVLSLRDDLLTIQHKIIVERHQASAEHLDPPSRRSGKKTESLNDFGSQFPEILSKDYAQLSSLEVDLYSSLDDESGNLLGPAPCPRKFAMARDPTLVRTVERWKKHLLTISQMYTSGPTGQNASASGSPGLSCVEVVRQLTAQMDKRMQGQIIYLE